MLSKSSAPCVPFVRRIAMSDSATWEELCRGLKRSDDRAFERIYMLIRDELLGYVLSIVSDGPTAHDLVQDVFVSLWNLRTSLDPSQPLRGYLFRMARNRAYRHLRDERIHSRKHDVLQREKMENSSTKQPDDDVDADLLESRLRQWLEQLPARQKEALVLSRFHGLSHREIGSVMGISPRTVNNHIMRALDAIRNHLEAHESMELQTGPRHATGP